jgi:predicted nucleic acid-binding protein
MAKILIFDTDILIDYLLGIADAKTFFASFTRTERYTTAISLMEVYRGARDKRELNIFKRFFLTSFAEVLYINESASKKATELIEVYTLSHGLLLADGLIAAMALLYGGQLVTGNSKHFDYIPSLSLLVPPYRIKP